MQEKRQNIAVIKSRLLEYLDYKGIKRPEFCRNSKISESLFKGIGLKSEIGGDKLVSILSYYPEINPGWLITGEGEMLLGRNEEGASGQEPACISCRYLKDVERYQEDIARYKEDIHELRQELRTLRQQQEPSRKRRTA